MDILEIINDIASFVQYFSTGFLFFNAYNFAAYLQRESQAEYFIVKGITASFIINSIVTSIFENKKIDTQYYFVVLIASAVILGLFLGRARRFVWVQAVIEKLFQRTISDNMFTLIWESISVGNCLYIRFKLRDDLNYYEGQIGKISSNYQEPTILLKYYVVEDENGNRKRDFSNCDCAYMIVKWSQIENLEMASEEFKEKPL